MDDKKDDKKSDKKKSAGNPLEEGFVIAFIVFLVLMLIMRAVSYFTPMTLSGEASTPVFSNSYIETITGGPNGWYANTLHFLGVIVSTYVKVATVFSVITFLVILYVVWLTYRLSREEAKKDKMAEITNEIPSEQSQKWQQVLMHANSQNAAEWRLSILEADVLLEDLLSSLGYSASTLGEKLKSVQKGDFKTIDAAWEAHKVRNLIAHEGTDFPIDQRDVKRVMELYGQVFREFSYV